MAKTTKIGHILWSLLFNEVQKWVKVKFVKPLAIFFKKEIGIRLCKDVPTNCFFD